MKKKGRFMFFFFTLIMTVIYTTGYVFAATPSYGGRYISGVGNVAVYVDYASGAGYWNTFFNNAANNWMYTGFGANPIYMNFVSSNYGTSMDMYSKSNSYWTSQGSYDILAETYFFNSNSKRMDPSNGGNWMFNQILINDDLFKQSSFSDEQALGTIIHEMGHAFGLAHFNNNKYSIMCQTAHGRKVQRVQQTDNDTINALY